MTKTPEAGKLKAALHWMTFGLAVIPTDEIQNTIRGMLETELSRQQSAQQSCTAHLWGNTLDLVLDGEVVKATYCQVCGKRKQSAQRDSTKE